MPQPQFPGRTLTALSAAELREVQRELLDWLSARCRDEGLDYVLFAGTLLGAVRHRGYIPWDDDIDVAMPRRDLDRLLASLASSSHEDVVVLAPGAAGYPFPFVKLGRRGTLLVDHTSGGLELPINIDVFPLDGLPGPAAARRLRQRLLRLGVRLLEAGLGEPPLGWRRTPHRIAAGIAAALGHARVARLLGATARTGNRGTPAYVAASVWGPGWALPSTSLWPVAPVTFEGREYAGPHDADDTLRRCYGEWRKLPPAEAQVTHHDFTGYRSTAG